MKGSQGVRIRAKMQISGEVKILPLSFSVIRWMDSICLDSEL